MNLEELNNLNKQDCLDWFEHTCAAKSWCIKMEQSRPFRSHLNVMQLAQGFWASMTEEDYLQAFDGHPMIGDMSTLKAKYANTSELAQNEQSGTAHASEDTLRALYEANHLYLEKNGFIFIICASGLSAHTMLKALQARLKNSRQQEIEIAAKQQIKITLLRINKGLSATLQEKVEHQ